MIKCVLITVVSFYLHNNLFSQTFVENSFYHFESGTINSPEEREKTQISAGIGSSFTFGSHSKDHFSISLDFIPRLSDKMFLDLKIDGLTEGKSFITLLSIIPEY